jgi:cell division inhibitor SulA
MLSLPSSSSPALALTVNRTDPISHLVWRADRIGHAVTPGLPTGFKRLDAELPGGGWPPGTLTELITRDPGMGELRLLIPLLRQLTRSRRVVVMLAPPHMPYAPALADFGIDLDWLLMVQATHAADRLWAIEQTLRSSAFGAMLAWLPTDRTRPEHLRRLQLAASQARGPSFLLRGLPAQFESSPAPLRLLLQPQPAQRLAITLLKRRGPVLAKPILIDLPQPEGAVRLREPNVAPTSVHTSVHTSVRTPGHTPHRSADQSAVLSTLRHAHRPPPSAVH